MAITVQPYDVKEFNSLLNFSDVGPIFDAIGGTNIIANKMMPLFRSHGVEHDLGVTLLHRHFELEDGEQLIDIRGTSVPVSFETSTPSIWALQGGDQCHLRPMEFSIDNIKAPSWDRPQFQVFLKAFTEVVKECGGQDIFGLCAYPGNQYPGRVEFTSGRANVNLRPSEVGML